MRCPYCDGKFSKKIEYTVMTQPKSDIFEFILQFGEKGIGVGDIKNKFLPKMKSEKALDARFRKIVFEINRKIAPSRIVRIPRTGIVRVERRG